MNYLEYAKNQQKIEPDLQIGEPVSIDVILDAEHKLGCKFPTEYKKFLMQCGYVSCGDTYINGLTNDKEKNLNMGLIIGSTLYAREKYNIPLNMIVLDIEADEAIIALSILDKPSKDHYIALIELAYADFDPQLEPKTFEYDDDFTSHFKGFIDEVCAGDDDYDDEY